jgi:hypothetical protein
MDADGDARWALQLHRECRHARNLTCRNRWISRGWLIPASSASSRSTAPDIGQSTAFSTGSLGAGSIRRVSGTGSACQPPSGRSAHIRRRFYAVHPEVAVVCQRAHARTCDSNQCLKSPRTSHEACRKFKRVDRGLIDESRHTNAATARAQLRKKEVAPVGPVATSKPGSQPCALRGRCDLRAAAR